MGQYSSSGRGGRHRQENLRRHRAPAFPALFASRGRSTLSVTALTATLAAGVGAASLAASARPIGSVDGSELSTAVHAPASLPIAPSPGGATPPGGTTPPRGTTPPGDVAQAKTHRKPAALTERARPQNAPVRRKNRPAAPRAWSHPLASAEVTSCFGDRWGRLHAGVDLAAPHGTPVVAAGSGVIVAAGTHSGYGNAILIDHGDGWLTHYGHLSAIAVEVDQQVRAGEHIGDEGSTGHSTGPHLHFEVHKGHFQHPVEPTAWLKGHGVEIPGCSSSSSEVATSH